jgi:hypothetical protein
MVDRAIIWYLGYNMMRASWRVSATKRDVLYRVKRGRAGYVSYLICVRDEPILQRGSIIRRVD